MNLRLCREAGLRGGPRAPHVYFRIVCEETSFQIPLSGPHSGGRFPPADVQALLMRGPGASDGLCFLAAPHLLWVVIGGDQHPAQVRCDDEAKPGRGQVRRGSAELGAGRP